MNRLFRYLRGYCVVELSSADPTWILNRLSACRVPFWRIKWIDSFTVHLCVFMKDVSAVDEVAAKCMGESRWLESKSFRSVLKDVCSRPVLLIGLLLPLLVILTAQNYLLFYEVEGNGEVPEELILRELETLDVGFGTFGPDIKPKWIKDHMLNQITQLQWITVTQNGSVGKVAVRQRADRPKVVNRKQLANIVASKSGQITAMSVLEGQALKKTGDFVTSGEMLVSGVVDLDIKFAVVRAQAEIYANTWQSYQVLTPEECVFREKSGKKYYHRWLQVGKKRIKITGNSGILHTGCDKMISRKVLTLPGGNALPVMLITEIYTPYDLSVGSVSETNAAFIMSEYARGRMKQTLQAGNILRESTEFLLNDGKYSLRAQYMCHEMIAQTIEGKWNKEDFAHD